MTQTNFELVTTSQGALSILDGRVGEIMHNPLGPWLEIQELYIKPSQLAQRLQAPSEEKELVLYDVGLGAGSNAMAAILLALTAHKETKDLRGLRILSFEQDLSLAQFTLRHRDSFPEFAGAWQAFQELFAQGSWKHPEIPIQWELHHGDFTQALNSALPIADLIFYDPYSPKKNQEMWTYETFHKLRKKCHPSQGPETLLLTYSRATSVRAALLLAGFFVGKGRPIGLKEETTLASTLPEALDSPLQQRWLERWRRSHQALPTDLAQDDENDITQWSQQLEGHPQFASS